MSRFRLSRQLLVAAGVCALLLGAATVQAQQYDDSQPADQSQAYDNSDQAPGRVARLAYLSGQVQFAPAGESDWGSVEVNRPMVIGDRLLTGNDGRAVLELGDASIRIDNGSAFDFLNLDQNNVQVELSQGTLNVAVRQLAQGETFEVDTPTVAFVAAQPGIYRIDDDPSGTGSMVTVFQGSGTVYGENGVSRQVAAGTSYRFNDSTLADVQANALPQPDDFDSFCEARDANYNRYVRQEQQYVPPDMIGSEDLDQYGQWDSTPDYGTVWYPSSVPAGWAPYRYGHWAWIDPWGWTWVGDEPWGFAPFHYGRWVYVRDRWGWMPGPVQVQPVYAPALVAFIGGSGLSLSINIGGGGPVGWFPLGPRDVYTPWFPASRNYFTNVNVTNIRNVYINKTVINNFYTDYQAGRAPPRGGHDYAYRAMPGAVTAVPRNVFTGARPVRPAVLKLDRTQLARSEVALRPAVVPDRSSLGLRNPTMRPTVIKGREPFARPVVARHQPPPRPVDFAARQKVIASQHGQPLTPAQLQNLRKTEPAPREERVKLVPAAAGIAAGAAAIGAMHRATPPRPSEPAARTQPARSVAAPRPGEPSARRPSPTEPFKNTVHPIQAPVNPVGSAPPRPNELPSARFAHPNQSDTLPRPPVVRPAEPQRNAPASGRLPVVQPVERAPQPVDNRAAQQQREAEAQAQQRAREQQAQQAQQRARDLQMQQQRQAQAQAQEQQRMREQQAQQRQAQMQEQQRARDQQAQQQRQLQEQQRAVQMQQQQREIQMQQQQREMQMRQQQVQQREMQRAPQPRNNPPPQRREPPSSKRPPPSSGNR
ncbi:MAG: hypothetical protein OJF61_003022 [Rhodanobacteraceae bacterium]|jgi:hypothetical protein|nr:MAG: hypothetical protein OJF61_003022 [Rhodanobacteraceae bacterium]